MKLKNSTAETFKENNAIFSSEGNFHAKEVQDNYGAKQNQPAVVQTRSKWIIGDVTEVLDRNIWKLGKILKMLKNNYFVIRLADCIQLKEFHISSLRIPHALEAPQSKPFPAADKATGRGKRQSTDRVLPRSRAVQQMSHRGYEPGSSAKKRKATAEAPFHPSKRAHPRKIAAASMAESYLHSSSQAIEDAECSVASCSVNDPCHLDNGGGTGKRRPGAGCLPVPDDAMSACPCTSGAHEEEEEEEGAVDVHGLELEAYRSTMRALYASGPLTWEQEALLTNLRLSLNISNEEHLLQLRRLLSAS